MTLETAQRIVNEGKIDKETEAILRGGMNICETKEDGSRKYVWVKVKPTQTDDESSIDVAMKNYRRRKLPRSKMRIEQAEIRFQDPAVTTPPDSALSPQHEELKQDEVSPLSQLISYLKRIFSKFVKTMDGLVEE